MKVYFIKNRELFQFHEYFFYFIPFSLSVCLRQYLVPFSSFSSINGNQKSWQAILS